MTRFDAVLLDVDGTLVASNDAHARAWVDVLRRDGLVVEVERVRRLIGMGGDLLVREITGLDPDDPRSERLRDERDEVFLRRYLCEVGAFPGARALVDRLREAGYRVVVATSASEDSLRPLLARANLEELVGQATSSDDAEVSKPAPDIVEAAIEKAGVSAERAVLVGDTPYDMTAATRAGAAFIGVRSGGWRDEQLPEAIAIYDDVAELLRRFDRSPLGGR